MPAAGAAAQLEIAADTMAVRRALVEMRATWRDMGLGPGICDAAEQALAEALNNVVEHAQAGRPQGRIILSTRRRSRTLLCEICDDGAALPRGTIPHGAPPPPGTRRRDLPEGGFGWFLIRALASDIRYSRRDGWNRLRFTVAED